MAKINRNTSEAWFCIINGMPLGFAAKLFNLKHKSLDQYAYRRGGVIRARIERQIEKQQERKSRGE